MAEESQNEPKAEQAGDFRFCNAAKAYVKEINSNQGTGKIESKSILVVCSTWNGCS